MTKPLFKFEERALNNNPLHIRKRLPGLRKEHFIYWHPMTVTLTPLLQGEQFIQVKGASHELYKLVYLTYSV
jgi:hypothetical protein